MRKLFVLLAAGMAVAGGLTAPGAAAGGKAKDRARASPPGNGGRPGTGAAAGGTAKPGPWASQRGKVGGFSAIVPARAFSGRGCAPVSGLGADPPLLWGGGPVMANDPAHPITITPIYWEPNSP